MRDFKNGGDINVQGNFHIVDGSQTEHKLLIHCSNDELLRERPFRLENIALEQKIKMKKMIPFYAISLILLVAAATWSAINGKSDIVSVLMGAGSLLLGFQSIRATFEPNEFQTGEKAAVREINKILKTRRVE